MSKKKVDEFKKEVWKYYGTNRRDFPWRRTTNPYRILVSEMMLQQTQTFRVEPKYKMFLKMFPTVSALARAPIRNVLEAWQGLGYNRRALFLHRAANMVLAKHKGKVPSSMIDLVELPGIGPNTAGAITAFSFNKPVVFIETNIRRVFIHFFFQDRGDVNDAELTPLIEEAVDHKRPRDWYYALMDYGAMLAKKVPNPNRRSAHYTKQTTFQGSRRQVRGKILGLLLKHPASADVIIKEVGTDPQVILSVLEILSKEGFIFEKRGRWQVKKTS